jgi:hypothetical protein
MQRAGDWTLFVIKLHVLQTASFPVLQFDVS